MKLTILFLTILSTTQYLLCPKHSRKSKVQIAQVSSQLSIADKNFLANFYIPKELQSSQKALFDTMATIKNPDSNVKISQRPTASVDCTVSTMDQDTHDQLYFFSTEGSLLEDPNATLSEEYRRKSSQQNPQLPAPCLSYDDMIAPTFTSLGLRQSLVRYPTPKPESLRNSEQTTNLNLQVLESFAVTEGSDIDQSAEPSNWPIFDYSDLPEISQRPIVIDGSIYRYPQPSSKTNLPSYSNSIKYLFAQQASTRSSHLPLTYSSQEALIITAGTKALHEEAQHSTNFPSSPLTTPSTPLSSNNNDQNQVDQNSIYSYRHNPYSSHQSKLFFINDSSLPTQPKPATKLNANAPIFVSNRSQQ